MKELTAIKFNRLRNVPSNDSQLRRHRLGRHYKRGLQAQAPHPNQSFYTKERYQTLSSLDKDPTLFDPI